LGEDDGWGCGVLFRLREQCGRMRRH
jgi:hypothetical protein